MTISSPAQSPRATVVTDALERPVLDDRLYRVVQLANNLEALLICDPTADRAGAALDVNVGAFQDPVVKGVKLNGLAHYNEHLLFMGSKPFPLENEYRDFLSQHGGHLNAYTAAEQTNYFFEVLHEHLEGALDRFAPFFLEPLFRLDCTDRELRAVDLENKKNLQNDNWRLYQLDKSLSNPEYPYSGFSTGNLETLRDTPLEGGIDVRESLLEWYASHYLLNLMKLAVLGREDLDTLERWVVERFLVVPNTNRPPPLYGDSEPYPGLVLRQVIRARPVEEQRLVELTFPVPSQDEHWELQPLRYVLHLVGHEGEGLVLHYLKVKGWATGLSSGARKVGAHHELFMVDVDLTKDGLEHVEEVTETVFQYLDLLRQAGPQQWIHDEMATIADNEFRFMQKLNTANTVSGLALRLQKLFLPRELLLSHNKFRAYNPAAITDFLVHLVPANHRVTLVAPELAGCDQREEWYGTEYSVEPIGAAWFGRLEGARASANSALLLPAPNKFLPTNFELQPLPEAKQPAEHPLLIHEHGPLESPTQRVWFKQDDQFKVPKGFIMVLMHIPGADATPAGAALVKLFTELVEDDLEAMSYDAGLGGIRYWLSPLHGGRLQLVVGGYNDKLPVLAEHVLRRLRLFVPLAERFAIVRDNLARRMRNEGYGNPYLQVYRWRTVLLDEEVWSRPAKLEALQRTTHEQLLRVIPLLFQDVRREVLVYGNFARRDALAVASTVDQVFHDSAPLAGARPVFAGRSFWMPSGTFRYDLELDSANEVNSAIEYFVQFGKRTDHRCDVLAELLGQMIKEPAFTQLRTQEQLGYVVFAGVQRNRTLVGMRVLVQLERTTDYLEWRIDEFLKAYGERLRSMPQEEFAKHVKALVAKVEEKRKNLNEAYNEFEARITTGYYDFKRRERIAAIVKTVTHAELVEFYHEHVLLPTPLRLVVHLHLQCAPVQGPEKVAKVAVTNWLYENAVEHDDKTVSTAVDAVVGEVSGASVAAAVSAVLGLLETRRDTLAAAVAARLLHPTPEGYPQGDKISTIGSFQLQLPLTEAVQPVVLLALLRDDEAKL